MTIYKGRIWSKDLKLGTGLFVRDFSNKLLTEINKSHIPRKVIDELEPDDETGGYYIRVSDEGEFTFVGNQEGIGIAITDESGAEITDESGATITDETGVGACYVTLPRAKKGRGRFNFIVGVEGVNVKVIPGSVDYFRDCVAGKYKLASVLGSLLIVWCDVDGIWEWNYEGTWADEG